MSADKQIIVGTLTIGAWQEFSLYLMYLFFPIMMFGMIVTQMGQAAASADRIFEILDAKSDIVDKPNASKLPAVKGDVKFENVTFRYVGGGDPVLKNVTFEAKPGETIALLGATGSGKTSIINFLPRFYDPTEGRITIDGHDLRDVTLDSLRSQIGIVLQETTLFSGTIAENIAFGKPEATLEEIQSAAKAAAAHDFIMSFPEGYDTHVGERGTTLSGGQKQRVAIARALLLDPRILILDDSTSSVDVATESHIQEALETLMKGRTSFVIAQRISTVINADKILVLEKGEVVAQGKHAQLMEEEPIYAEIYNSQILAHQSGGDTMMHGRAGGMLNQETMKPRNLSETLGRLGKYFGRFWYMIVLCRGLCRRLHLDSSDLSRINRTSHRLFPRALAGGSAFAATRRRATASDQKTVSSLLAWDNRRPIHIILFTPDHLQSLSSRRIHNP